MSNTTLIAFDYAIKYLLKDKGDYEIVEGFISALLVSKGYKPIKIVSLLESASNVECAELKKSIADLIVEDEQGNNYIIEIDRSYTNLSLHKACFNTSRLIVDNIGAGYDYSSIKKAFHINLLYFPFAGTKSPMNHGRVIFHEIDRVPVDVHLMNTSMCRFDSYDIFPEYFLISIPLFDDVITQEIDEWLYVLKHSEVRSDFKSPYMEKVAQRLDILKMNNKERIIYNRTRNDSLKGRDYIVAAEEIGEARGEARGERKKALEIAKKMLSKGKSIDEIIEFTELSAEEIKEIQDL